jgi:hypothetical protein
LFAGDSTAKFDRAKSAQPSRSQASRFANQPFKTTRKNHSLESFTHGRIGP